MNPTPQLPFAAAGDHRFARWRMLTSRTVPGCGDPAADVFCVRLFRQKNGVPRCFQWVTAGDREPRRGEKLKAQGNALGKVHGKVQALQGRHLPLVSPLQGEEIPQSDSQGVALGFRRSPLRGFGPRSHRLTENSEEPKMEGKKMEAIATQFPFFCPHFFAKWLGRLGPSPNHGSLAGKEHSHLS
jgi:hypothetical protein